MGPGHLSELESFSATIDSDPERLFGLRTDVSAWLAANGIDGEVGDAVVLATHEAAAGAIENGASAVTVEGAFDGDVVTISLSTAGTAPLLDLDGHDERSRLLHALVPATHLETTSTHSSVRLEGFRAGAGSSLATRGSAGPIPPRAASA